MMKWITSIRPPRAGELSPSRFLSRVCAPKCSRNFYTWLERTNEALESKSSSDFLPFFLLFPLIITETYKMINDADPRIAAWCVTCLVCCLRALIKLGLCLTAVFVYLTSNNLFRTPEGDKFVIKDPERFANEVIPQYFDHNKVQNRMRWCFYPLYHKMRFPHMPDFLHFF